MTFQLPYRMIGWLDGELRRSSLKEGSTDNHESPEFEDHGNPGGWWSSQVGERD